MALAIHSCSLSVVHHMMSLNIDMKIIHPWSCAGSLILFMNFWTSRTSCNVVNPGKIFHSNSIGLPSIVSKGLHSDELLNHVNLCARLMTFSPPTKDQCFHEESSQLIAFTPVISSDCLTINFSDLSKICFIVRSFPVFLMEYKISK